MKRSFLILILVLAGAHFAMGADKIRIVSSLPDYGSIAEMIGGDQVEVTSIARGYQDPHFVKAKPSFSREMADADLFLTTGLDLELWVPTLIDHSRNPTIREGANGYVSVSHDVPLLQVPTNPNRSGGDIHIYGNPHIYTDPLRGLIIGRNILTGLKKVDPAHSADYQKRFDRFQERIYEKMYGEKLVQLVGGDQLAQLSWSGTLGSFLAQNQYGGQPLASYLGGWMQEASCLKGKRIVAYHKNWIYFTDRFGIQIADYVEARPGIPPSAKHVVDLIEEIQSGKIKALLAANYFDEKIPRMIEEKTGAKALIVPVSVGGTSEAKDYFTLFDIWIEGLRSAFPECHP